MNLQKALTLIIARLDTISSIEGAFLSGSLINKDLDDFSDIDMGIATKNNVEAFNDAFALWHDLISMAGNPIHYIERGWEHCKMIAALFGKSQFPTIGLEIDIIFSQLQYVSEQMPYSEYRIVFDRNGKLQSTLAKTSQSKPNKETKNEILQHLKWFPFYAHDAIKACKREDEFQVQSLLEEMRKLIFFAAAARQGKQIYGSKRAYRCLSTIERQVIEQSFRRSDENMVAQLTQLYIELTKEIQSKYRIRNDLENAKAVFQELL